MVGRERQEPLFPSRRIALDVAGFTGGNYIGILLVYVAAGCVVAEACSMWTREKADSYLACLVDTRADILPDVLMFRTVPM